MRKSEALQHIQQLSGYLDTSNRLLEKIEDERDEARQMVESLSYELSQLRTELDIYMTAYNEVTGRLSAHLGIEPEGVRAFSHEILQRTSDAVVNQPF
jgi:chromosome segregation ATPase